MSRIQQVKKELGITNKDIAKFFYYKTEASYYHATRRPQIENGIVKIYELTKERWQEKENQME